MKISFPLCEVISHYNLFQLTVDVDVDAGGDGLGVVVVVPPTLQPGVHVLPGEPLQLHGVPALAWRDFLPAGVEQLPRPPPGDAGAGPA